MFARTDYRPPYQNCGLTTRKDGYMYRGDSGTESQSACCRQIHVRAMCTTTVMTIEEATADVDVKVLDAATLKEGESLAKRDLNGWTLIGHLDHRDFTRN